MKSIKILMGSVMLLSSLGLFAQIKNAKTQSFKVSGNCGMCEKKIEKSGSINKIATVDWDKDQAIATITYDSQKTNPDEILKKIALVGYDNEQFLAPDDVYTELPGCCQYERSFKNKAVVADNAMTNMDHANHNTQTDAQTNELSNLLAKYFDVKNALVKSDAKLTSMQATELLTAAADVDMTKLPTKVHNVWMNVMKDISSDVKSISQTQDLKRQRMLFSTLSKNMYELMKFSHPANEIYLNHCPMFNDGNGADWLSAESGIKNPYYGSQMLTCGKTIETIK